MVTEPGGVRLDAPDDAAFSVEFEPALLEVIDTHLQALLDNVPVLCTCKAQFNSPRYRTMPRVVVELQTAHPPGTVACTVLAPSLCLCLGEPLNLLTFDLGHWHCQD